MGKRSLSKKEIEELKKKEQEEAAAHVIKTILPCTLYVTSLRYYYVFQAFQEFVETFHDTPINVSKVWVKAGTYDAGARRT